MSLPIIPWRPGERPDRLAAILQRAEGPSPEQLAAVTEILAAVRDRGDAALLDLTERFDGVRLDAGELRIGPDRLKELAAGVDPVVRQALMQAAANILAFHELQREQGFSVDGEGSRLGQRLLPIRSVGLYVPGGTAAYPSSVLMNALPAKVARVPRLVAVTPPGALRSCPALAAALLIAEVDEVYCVGGAQAIGALAHGTESIPRVDKIVGPGNLWVATAKRLVFGAVGIDSFAGPSEVVVLAEPPVNPTWVAADLLAQAEHDAGAAAIAITWDAALAQQISAQCSEQLLTLPRRETAAASINSYGAVFLTRDAGDGYALANLLAAEHVELMVNDVDAAVDAVTVAGALFLGAHSPEPVGDYFAGPNHVLPTAGTARFSSALGVSDFVVRTSLVRYDEDRLRRDGPAIIALARAEGLEAHARAVAVRIDDPAREARRTSR